MRQKYPDYYIIMYSINISANDNIYRYWETWIGAMIPNVYKRGRQAGSSLGIAFRNVSHIVDHQDSG